jgi:polyphosphate:AMP phosphotransferase
MFRTAELGKRISKKQLRERVQPLREGLLEAQSLLREAGFPVLVLFGGVDGAGKGDAVNALNEWMDPRWVFTRAFEEPGQEELERPEYWRFWLALPPKGRIALFLSAWYSNPLLRRAQGGGESDFERSLQEIVAFEQQLADDGALILKFWLHLSRKEQEKRFRRLENDPLQSWRVTPKDWKNWQRYDHFVAAAERIIGRTSTGAAPWHIVEGVDPRYASLRVGEILLETIQKRLAEQEGTPKSAAETPSPVADVRSDPPLTVLDTLDTSQELAKPEYGKLLALYQGRMNQLQRRARDKKVSTILVFEGSDAAGKGGVIRRINAALDSRGVRVIATSAPTDEERAQHYLWRFWRHIPRAGCFTIFDRSWYGRVLVERVEGFASEKEWRRAYAEINQFEQQLVDHGIVLVKFWMHISGDEQLRRFREREQTPHKRWKLTDEDWRNREKRDAYAIAVHDMVERTSTRATPWILVGANDKRYARVKVLEHVCTALEARVGPPDEAPTRTKKQRKA